MSETTKKTVIARTICVLCVFLVCSVIAHQFMLAVDRQQEINEQWQN